ncbi:hypothetical protein DT076_08020 [Desertihabitans brevis]|uniref:Multidrug transporter n=1 Tax=Desertihabitans brevis TaxID=2268447 RepID=A0A367YWQ3_9ACTN|nr:phosphodiester glycosidase family protein [Desertihabitans brevis]RCK69949.1 hypothetical protein DT076_08020 [Desertihabitans brevis]
MTSSHPAAPPRPSGSTPARLTAFAAALLAAALAVGLLPAAADDHGRPELTGSSSTLLQQATHDVAPGLAITSFQRLQPQGWVTGHVMTADLDTPSLSLDVVDGGTVSASNQTVSELAGQADAVAAVNGDYFDINASGAPVGTNVSSTGGLRTAAPEPRESLTVTDEKAAVQQLMSAATVRVDGVELDVPAVNSPSWRADQLALFTPVWGAHPVGSLLTAGEDVRAVELVDGRVTRVLDAAALAEPLAEGTSVLVGRGAASARLAGVEPGQPVQVSLEVSADVDLAVGGAQRLLVDGEVTGVDQATAARTAVGVSQDGTRLWVVAVDGRQADAHGMTLQELAALLDDLGAWNAVNLDGGGSTAMVARPAGERDLRLVNRPSDGSERLDANALVFRSRATGQPDDVLARPLLDPPVGLDVPGADALLPGLTRTVVASGLDADHAAVEARGRFTAAPRSLLAVDGTTDAPVPGQQAVVVRGVAPGTGQVTFDGRLPGGRTSERIPLTVHQEMVGLEPSAPLLALPAGEPGAAAVTLSLTAVDADGHRVPVETRDVTVGVEGGAEVRPSGPATFAVTSTVASGAAEITLEVLGHEVRVPVTIGYQTEAVADFSDAAAWKPGSARAPVSVTPADGPEGSAGLAVEMDFTTSTATRGAYAVPPAPVEVDGQPRAFTLWVHGNGQGQWPRLQVTRGDGTSTNLDGPLLSWTGWRQITFPVPAGTAYPLTITAIRLMETRASASYTDRVVLAGLDAQVPVAVEQPERPRRVDPAVLTQGDVDDRPQRIAVMSDTQFVARDGEDGALVQAGRRTLREIVAERPDLLLVAGDLVDEASDADFALARKVLEEEVGQTVPWVYVPGNHEIMGGGIERFEQHFGETMTTRDLGGTRVITLDSSSGTLHPGGDTTQLRELERLLDEALATRSITGVVVVDHHPVDDPHPDQASQLGDRTEAAALQRVLNEFRAAGKSAAMVSGHVGTFAVDAVGGVTRYINGNSGKSPSGAADEGGFTGWSMLGIDPGEGVVGFSPDLGDRTRWLQVQTHARVDQLVLSVPSGLEVGEQAEAVATITQDGTREVPVAWPVTATWGGDGVRLAGSAGTAVLELDPATRTLTALAPGTATVRVEVNGVGAEQQVTVG